MWFGLGSDNVFTQIAIFFSKMAVVTFGGAYAVLAYVAQQAVDNYHWVTAGEMLDGLGMAETTPGPLIMVTQFVGFLAAWRDPGGLPPLLAATLGGLLTTWVTFVPCFLDLLRRAVRRSAALQQGVERRAGRRHRSRRRRDPEPRRVVRPARAVCRTGAGAVARRVGRRAGAESVDVPSLVLSLAAAVAIFRFKIGMIPVLLACSLAGVIYSLALGL